MVEVIYRNNYGSTDTPCPFGEKVRLVGGILTGQSADFKSEEIRIVGSSTCTECKYYAGRGSMSEKAGTSRMESRLCNHPEGPSKYKTSINIKPVSEK